MKLVFKKKLHELKYTLKTPFNSLDIRGVMMVF